MQQVHALQQMLSGQGTFGRNIILALTARSTGCVLADFQGGIEVVLFHTPASAVTRATFDHLDIGVRDQPQHLGCLVADVLGAGVTGHVQADAAVQRLRFGGQPFVLRNIDYVFGDVPGGLGEARRTAGSSGRISGHSNFSISAQDGTRATTS